MASVATPDANRHITEFQIERKTFTSQAQEVRVSLGANRRFLLSGLLLLSATFFIGCSSEDAKPAAPAPPK